MLLEMSQTTASDSEWLLDQERLGPTRARSYCLADSEARSPKTIQIIHCPSALQTVCNIQPEEMIQAWFQEIHFEQKLFQSSWSPKLQDSGVSAIEGYKSPQVVRLFVSCHWVFFNATGWRTLSNWGLKLTLFLAPGDWFSLRVWGAAARQSGSGWVQNGFKFHLTFHKSTLFWPEEPAAMAWAVQKHRPQGSRFS
jgi:hypothetical protein